MRGEDSARILDGLQAYFTGDLLFLNYEMINPQDPFGRMMLENLEERGC